MTASLPLRRTAWPIAVGLAVLAFAAASVHSTRTAPETYPVADTATTSLYTLRAAQGELTGGSYSRFGWSHPGPLLYQALAGPYALSGRREIALKWTALAINLLSLGALLAITSRRSPVLAASVALALIPLLWREQRLLFSAWNPFLPVLALGWAMAAAADLAAGDGWRSRWGLLLLVVPLSFAVQAHAGLVMPALACGLAALAGLRGTDRGAARAGLLIAAMAAALLWAVPLLAELRERPGNLQLLARFLLDDGPPRASWPRALEAAAYMTLGPALPAWTLHFVEVPAGLPAWQRWLLGVLIAGVAWAAWDAHRRGARFEAAFAAIGLLTTLAVVAAAKGVVGPMSDYLLLWATVVGSLGVAIVVTAIAGRLAAVRLAAATTAPGVIALSLMGWAAIGGHRLAAKHAEQARDTTVRALAVDLQAWCRARGIARPVLAYAPGDAWQEGAGLVLQFAKADQPIAVDDAALYLVGRPFARRGDERAEFYLMPVTGALPDDAGRTEWVTTRGAYRIVQLRLSDP